MSQVSALQVLIVTTSYPSEESPVSGVFVQRMAQAVQKAGALVQVVTPALRDQPLCRELGGLLTHFVRYGPSRWQVLAQVPGGIPVALKRSRGNLILVATLFAAMAWRTFWLARRVSVIHANWAVSALIAQPGAWLWRKPILLTTRGEDFTRAISGGRTAALLFRTACACASRVTVVSEFMARELVSRNWIRAENVSVVENGVAEVDTPHMRLREAGEPLRLVVLGSLIPRKRVSDLLMACEHLSPQPTIVVIGDGSEAGPLKALAARLGLGASVQWLGAIPPERVGGFLAQSDCLVLTSAAEGRPNAVLEAMAAGLAVVTTRLPGVCDLVTHGEDALLFECGDVASLTAHLARLTADAALAMSLGFAARATIRRRGLTWGACGENYAALYRRLTARGT